MSASLDNVFQPSFDNTRLKKTDTLDPQLHKARTLSELGDYSHKMMFKNFLHLMEIPLPDTQMRDVDDLDATSDDGDGLQAYIRKMSDLAFDASKRAAILQSHFGAGNGITELESQFISQSIQKQAMVNWLHQLSVNVSEQIALSNRRQSAIDVVRDAGVVVVMEPPYSSEILSRIHQLPWIPEDRQQEVLRSLGAETLSKMAHQHYSGIVKHWETWTDPWTPLTFLTGRTKEVHLKMLDLISDAFVDSAEEAGASKWLRRLAVDDEWRDKTIKGQFDGEPSSGEVKHLPLISKSIEGRAAQAYLHAKRMNAIHSISEDPTQFDYASLPKWYGDLPVPDDMNPDSYLDSLQWLPEGDRQMALTSVPMETIVLMNHDFCITLRSNDMKFGIKETEFSQEEIEDLQEMKDNLRKQWTDDMYTGGQRLGGVELGQYMLELGEGEENDDEVVESVLTVG